MPEQNANPAMQSPPAGTGATPPHSNAFPGPPPPPETWSLNTNEEATVSGSELSAGGFVGSMQQILQQNTGYYVECEFLIGTQNIVRRTGILYDVGVSFIVLYETAEQRYTVCDFYSLKFITFYEPGREPTGPMMPRATVMR